MKTQLKKQGDLLRNIFVALLLLLLAAGFFTALPTITARADTTPPVAIGSYAVESSDDVLYTVDISVRNAANEPVSLQEPVYNVFTSFYKVVPDLINSDEYIPVGYRFVGWHYTFPDGRRQWAPNVSECPDCFYPARVNGFNPFDIPVTENVVFEAHYEAANEYTIFANVHNAQNESIQLTPKVTNLDLISVCRLLPDMINSTEYIPDGYRFIGWHVTDLPSNSLDVHNVSECEDCYYPLINGHSQFDWLASSDLHFEAHYERVLSLPETPFKEGYTFVGWYLDEELTTPYNGEPITADMTFHAKFTINHYIIIFDSAGGAVVESITVDWNTKPEIPTLSRVGYDFIGWFIGETEYTGEPIKADTTLTAKWEKKIFTVTFYVDGKVFKTLEVPYGTTFYEAMKANGMAYFNLIGENGVKDGKSGVIT